MTVNLNGTDNEPLVTFFEQNQTNGTIRSSQVRTVFCTLVIIHTSFDLSFSCVTWIQIITDSMRMLRRWFQILV